NFTPLMPATSRSVRAVEGYGGALTSAEGLLGARRLSGDTHRIALTSPASFLAVMWPLASESFSECVRRPHSHGPLEYVRETPACWGRPVVPNDFASIALELTGGDYVGRLRVGTAPPSGAPARPENILYFATVKDEANFTITSKVYYKAGELAFCDDFLPRIVH